MKSTIKIAEDSEHYRDVRIDIALHDDFKKEVYTVIVSHDKEFGMLSESDWTYVASEGAEVIELAGEPPKEVLDVYASLQSQAESLAENGQ